MYPSGPGRPPWDRRLWSKVAAWLLLVTLSAVGVNLAWTRSLLLEIRAERRVTEARRVEDDRFHGDLLKHLALGDETDQVALRQYVALRVDLAELRRRVRQLEAVTPVQAIRDRAK